MSTNAIDSFLDYKANTPSQCGNYQIDIPKLKEGEQYRFHFDMTACVGCHCCEVACNEQNGNSAEIKWRRVGEMEVGSFPETMQLFNSMSCNHCLEPACLIGCPTESYIKLENGIVQHNQDTCIGCQYCTWNCPYEVPVFNPEQGVVSKCHMCVDKLEAGQTPACIQACPAGAISIEVVNKDEWIKSDLAKEGVAPHLPDPNITKPTTRYTLPELPEGEIIPADKHHLAPAHPEFPLVFMTILTQMSFGGLVAILLGEILSGFGLNLPAPNFATVFAIFLASAIGLPLSALHLGRPILAMSAMKNYKTSWLSREAIALGAFTAILMLLAGVFYFGGSKSLKILLEILALGIGGYGIYAQSMIYRVPARPAWNRPSTTFRFFGSGYLGFLLVATVVSGYSTQAVPAILALVMLTALYQLYLILAEIFFYKYLSEDTPNFYQLNRSKTLLEKHFGGLRKIRIISLGFFGVAMPLFGVVLAVAGLESLTFWVLALALLGAFGSELIGRFLFYSTVVPTGLAGNFFAGNQRG